MALKNILTIESIITAGGIKMFKFKKWLWTKYQALMGSERAYAKYLAHFNHYKEHVVDQALQQEANVKAMTKEEFLKVWDKPKKQCKTGCCS